MKIVNNNKIVSVGYNGMPHCCHDDEYPWDKNDTALDSKYLYVCHAELNAILNARGTNLTGNRLYVALFPCNECAKAIIQSGITEVIYLSNKYKDTPETRASKRMLEAAGVKLTQLVPEKNEIVLDFDPNKI